MMWEKLSYRQRFRALGLAAILLLIVCYRFSFSKTIGEYHVYRGHAQTALLQNGMPSDQTLEAKEKTITAQLEQFVLDTLDNSKNLLGIVSSYCNEHQLILKEYKPAPLSPRDTLGVFTRTVMVEGSFLDCLKLTHALETRYKAGRVSAALFRSFTNASQTETGLHCTLYIQNLIMKPYEQP